MKSSLLSTLIKERITEEEEKKEVKRAMKKSGAEKKRVRRSSAATQNGIRDPNSDTPPRVFISLCLLL